MKWISVKDRLPKPDNWKDYPGGYSVLAVVEFYECGTKDISVEEFMPPKYRGKEYGTDENGFQTTRYHILYWMELPELPKHLLIVNP